MTKLILRLIRTYQLLISPILGKRCRFYPSCSQYSYDAVSRHGVLVGVRLSIGRLLRCHPFSKGGLDPLGDAK
jgi:hypothetical protein